MFNLCFTLVYYLARKIQRIYPRTHRRLSNNAVLFKSILSYSANVGCYAQHSHLSIIRIVKDQFKHNFQLLVYFKEIKPNYRLLL
jgi:hypothetical protein